MCCISWGRKELDTTERLNRTKENIFILQEKIYFLPATSPSCSLSNFIVRSVQFTSVAQSCPTLCDPMNLSTPGLPVCEA